MRMDEETSCRRFEGVMNSFFGIMVAILLFNIIFWISPTPPKDEDVRRCKAIESTVQELKRLNDREEKRMIP